MSEYEREDLLGVSVQRDVATKTSCTGVVKAQQRQIPLALKPAWSRNRHTSYLGE